MGLGGEAERDQVATGNDQVIVSALMWWDKRRTKGCGRATSWDGLGVGTRCRASGTKRRGKTFGTLGTDQRPQKPGGMLVGVWPSSCSPFLAFSWNPHPRKVILTHPISLFLATLSLFQQCGVSSSQVCCILKAAGGCCLGWGTGQSYVGGGCTLWHLPGMWLVVWLASYLCAVFAGEQTLYSSLQPEKGKK